MAQPMGLRVLRHVPGLSLIVLAERSDAAIQSLTWDLLDCFGSARNDGGLVDLDQNLVAAHFDFVSA